MAEPGTWYALPYKGGMDAGPAQECLQILAGALQEASEAVSRAQQLQQGAADKVAAELEGSLNRVHAMQATLQASLNSSSAGR